ncbi:hypothetical protein HH310_06940 [Actinoplanes sp. TBRC 11911]|uniref:hypothetical protein n=1 Tax=Actinoplanes sp. TBRC 11911 TaxID=2729386 RepID=UPI00145ECE14|nr:hypothetical protein [Actinoplanes sp. TBRC 11911]NMO50927.1 hypothetical protein [Actinoplanes sp. TBRC 11911]
MEAITTRTTGQAAMTGDQSAELAAARKSADRLAIALEEIGFDVGQEFPALDGAVSREGSAVVRIGDVQPDIADGLASALTRGMVGSFLVAPRQDRREVDHADEERSSQAEQISAWVEDIRKSDGGRGLAFHIHNASAMPVYEVELPLPGRPGEEEPRSESVGLVPPGQTIRRPAPAEWLGTYVAPEPAKIEFTDNVGRRWTRDERGTLSRAR